MALTRTDLLDPRAVAGAGLSPIAGAVNIPWSELAHRQHELPSKHEVLFVAGDHESRRLALDWLDSRGRLGKIREDVTFGASRERLRLWSASRGVERAAKLLEAGRALDLGCGSGRDSVFLADLGWSVIAVDVLEDALDRGRDLEARYLSADAPAIRWAHGSAEAVATEDAAFDLVVMSMFCGRALVRRLHGLLSAGGLACVETYAEGHRAATGIPANPDLVLHMEDMNGLEILECAESESAGRVRVIARKR